MKKSPKKQLRLPAKEQCFQKAGHWEAENLLPGQLIVLPGAKLLLLIFHRKPDSVLGNFLLEQEFVFRDGRFQEENLRRLVGAVGRDRLVLDLSCRKREGVYYIVTDRWQRFTEVPVNRETLSRLSDACSEFLVHGVDVEGKASGVEEELVAFLGDYVEIPVTYAGGVGTFSDLEAVKRLGRGRVDVTVGSALDLFGGSLEYEKVLAWMKEES